MNEIVPTRRGGRNDTHPDTAGGKTHFTVGESGVLPQTEILDWSDAVVANLEAFAAAIEGTASYPWSNDQLIHNIEIYEGIVQSADSGETVRLSAT